MSLASPYSVRPFESTSTLPSEVSPTSTAVVVLIFVAAGGAAFVAFVELLLLAPLLHAANAAAPTITRPAMVLYRIVFSVQVFLRVKERYARNARAVPARASENPLCDAARTQAARDGTDAAPQTQGVTMRTNSRGVRAIGLAAAAALAVSLGTAGTAGAAAAASASVVNGRLTIEGTNNADVVQVGPD